MKKIRTVVAAAVVTTTAFAVTQFPAVLAAVGTMDGGGRWPW